MEQRDTWENLPVVTTPRLDNHFHRTLDIVSASAHSPLGVYEAALTVALDRLRQAAANLNADAVVGLAINILLTETHVMRVYVTGTAVKLPWPYGTASPELNAEPPLEN